MTRRVVTVGNFDGVHLGHQALLSEACRLARDLRVASCAVFFHPHPTDILGSRSKSPLLTTVSRRAALIRAYGVDEVHVQSFDRAFAALEPEEFVRDVLHQTLGAQAVVVGSDFRFGRGRGGTVETLRTVGAQCGVDAHPIAPVMVAGEAVSSTRVRAFLNEGRVALAAQLLGRPYALEGETVAGDKVGRTLGFPTANILPPATLCPADGVYAVRVESVRVESRGRERGTAANPDGRSAGAAEWTGVTNIGVRPTRDAGRSIETHLFDFSGDLYGRILRIHFVARIRGEQRFEGLDALRRQIEQDCAAAREILRHKHAKSVASP